MFYSYSLNKRKTYQGNFNSPEEAATHALNGVTDNLVWVGEKTCCDTKFLINIDHLLEDLEENAIDWIGETDQLIDWTDKLSELRENETKMGELTKLVSDWLENENPTDFVVYQNEKIVTRAELIASGHLFSLENQESDGEGLSSMA